MIARPMAAALLALAMGAGPAQAQAPAQPAQASPQMSFFVTSANPGRGGDLGGLAGADAYCRSLATVVGAGNHNWRAYLSATGVNARDRIGRGPWRNAKGEVIAQDLAELHGQAAGLTKQTALTERGTVVNGRGDTPNDHDILTGSQPDGTAFAGSEDRTCRDWTSGGEGAAMLGHADRIGLRDDAASHSWNSSHPSRGCDLPALRTTGGAGLFYCFAAD
jgi:hypothetical protein